MQAISWLTSWLSPPQSGDTHKWFDQDKTVQREATQGITERTQNAWISSQLRDWTLAHATLSDDQTLPFYNETASCPSEGAMANWLKGQPTADIWKVQGEEGTFYHFPGVGTFGTMGELLSQLGVQTL